jgi:hypothetical protein
MVFHRSQRLILLTSVCLFGLLAVPPMATLGKDKAKTESAPQNLPEEEIRQFLLKGKIIKSKESSKGVTVPLRLTLKYGDLTRDASFQSVEIFKPSVTLSDGTTEIGFRDSWHFNVAGYELAKLLGLQDMVPVTVERTNLEGKKGSASWWLDIQIDEADRTIRKISPPDMLVWARQMAISFVFNELIYNSDPNKTNLLWSPDWKLYMIDFTRAFRLHENLSNHHERDLILCSRQLLEKLRTLDAAEVARVTKPHIDKDQVKALMMRRDKIVAYFDKLIAQKGEGEVIF